MTKSIQNPVIVCLQLNGANDWLNTLVPFDNPLYRDNRAQVGIAEDAVIKLNDHYGLHPSMGPVKTLWDQGKVALINGIGFDNSPRSHFRATDIWNTCEPEITGTEGWCARAVADLDPRTENPVKAVNVGVGLPRALVKRGVAVTSVSDLGSYGLMSDVSGIDSVQQRQQVLERFARIYSPAIGTGPVMDYLSQTGLVALEGADVIKTAPQKYSSTIEYANNPLAAKLRDIAKIHLADLGTQILYVQHASFDTHMGELPAHEVLLADVSNAVGDFFDDLEEHNAGDNVIMIIFTEFGRRVKDNGSGTDHGAGGGSIVIGNNVNGGIYLDYPSLKDEDLVFGDLKPHYDFRGFYSTILEDWMGLDPIPIVGGQFEKLNFIKN